MATTNENVLDPKLTHDLIGRVMQNPLRQAAQNACTRNDHAEVLMDRARSVSYNHDYAVTVDAEQKVTNQKSSGRCWMFAALNVCRSFLIKKYNLPNDFELSQSYTFFWDKMERANYFLETMMELAEEPLEGRLFQHLLKSPLEDGGQWDMFVNVVEKYGVCPKSVFPESFSSSSTRRMNWVLTHKLRGWAAELREEKDGAKRKTMKAAFLEEYLGALLVSLGTPPQAFDWTFKDKDGKYNKIANLTPMSFLRDHVNAAGFDFTEWISLINDPRNEYSKTYTVDKLGNVQGASAVKYINVDMETFKKYTTMQLDKGEAVWFGCDVGKHFNRNLAVMDTKLYNFELVYGTKPTMDKKTRLLYNDSLMTHAMVFTGYDKDADGRPSKWRVENSWGDGANKGAGCGCPYSLPSDKGYYLMTDAWFDEYMYQIIVKKSDLSPELKAVMDTDPVVLPAWDPMGALAIVHGTDDDM